MKLPLSWIKEFLDLTLSPEEIADALTLAGLEAEGIEEKEDDYVFDIGLTPNLGHCMSVLGIARELSAILQIPLKEKKIQFTETKEKASDLINVEIEDKSTCIRYCGRIVKNIQVGTSPSWLIKRLEACGLRSVNVAVDIGNFVMLECGQPLHMFDFDKLTASSIRISSAQNANTMITLDEVERPIPNGALLVLDGKKPVAFAGVMGDANSAVSETTKNVLIEAAHFTPEAIRKTSKQLNLRTESSLRFERGIDPEGITKALDRATQLLLELAGGEALSGIIDCVSHKITPSTLSLRPKKATQLLGITLGMGEIETLLERLEIKVVSESTDVIKVSIPSYRNDLKEEIDLIEEVGRMFGFNHIPRKVPRHASSPISHSPLFLFEEETRDKLISQGLQECLTCDLISPKLANMQVENTLDQNKQIHVLHPASIDQSVLRTSLLPGLLEMVKFNLDRQQLTISAFEVGHIHFKDKETFYVEPVAGIALTGKNSPHHHENKSKDIDFFDLKGHVENLLLSMRITNVQFEISHLHNFQPGRQAKVKIGDLFVGALGEIHPQHLRDLGISQRVYYAELNLHDLMKIKTSHPVASKPAAFPGSERDWTIPLKSNIPIGLVLNEIDSLSSPILEKVYLLDLYKSEKIGKDRKNATFRFLYRDQKKTIEYQEVEKEHKRVITALAEKLRDSVT